MCFIMLIYIEYWWIIETDVYTVVKLNFAQRARYMVSYVKQALIIVVHHKRMYITEGG